MKDHNAKSGYGFIGSGMFIVKFRNATLNAQP
jgi:hypothetical protein